ncbi:MAG TPA: hypothetical protein ENJ00_07545 [Phycisphaerales bacterium]|nr:hypothetical protein [Phycisphaerales bacterium]
MNTLLAIAIGLGAAFNLGFQPETAPDPGGHEYIFVFLDTGPAEDLTDEQLGEAFKGHFANMNRLIEEGKLLLAGPFGESDSGRQHRGLWIFQAPDVEAALEFGRTDPTVKAGIFVLDGYRFATAAPVDQLPRLEREDRQRREAEHADEWQGRAYIIAIAPMTGEMTGEMTGVFIAGRMISDNPDQPDRLILWLDAEDAESAGELLPDPDRWELHLWYGTKMVERMARE